jgi:hypothetical protein
LGGVGSNPRFEALPDGTFYSSAGTWANCRGVAHIHVRITPNASVELACCASKIPLSSGQDKSRVPGSQLSEHLIEEIFAGARAAFENRPCQIGLSFELIDAYVHGVDEDRGVHRSAGVTAVEGWFEWYNEQSASHI